MPVSANGWEPRFGHSRNLPSFEAQQQLNGFYIVLATVNIVPLCTQCGGRIEKGQRFPHVSKDTKRWQPHQQGI